MIEDGNFVIDPINQIIQVKNKSMTQWARYMELKEVFDRVDLFNLDSPLRTEMIIKPINGWKVEGFD